LEKAGKSGFALLLVSSWRRALVGFLIFSLVVSLATRTFRATIARGVTAKSGATQIVRQHMDRDAAEWTSPLPVFAMVLVSTFYSDRAQTHPPLGVLRLGENLYNRPPPSCREQFRQPEQSHRSRFDAIRRSGMRFNNVLSSNEQAGLPPGAASQIRYQVYLRKGVEST
jgi:hypothetical protein